MTSSVTVEKIEAANTEEFVTKACEWLKAKIEHCINRDGLCLLGLSGGTTPKPIYEKLGTVGGIDWSKVWIFAVDERYVPRDHQDSNYKLVFDSLLRNINIPEDHIVFPNTSLPLQECVADYDRQISQLLSKSPSRTAHIVTLGIGDDGHFASLFPNMPEESFQASLNSGIRAIHTTTNRFAVFDRITVTFKVIGDSAWRVFFLKGANKAKVWEELTAAPLDLRRWPPQKALEKAGGVVVICPS